MLPYDPAVQRYDPTLGLSAFAVIIGLAVGTVVGVLLGLGTLGVVLCAVVGLLVVGYLASALGIVGERQRPRDDDDLPSSYHDY